MIENIFEKKRNFIDKHNFGPPYDIFHDKEHGTNFEMALFDVLISL